MKVTSEKLPESRVLLTIEVEGDELESTLKKTYKTLAQRVRVPGFRPGKAPRAIIQNFVGKEAVIHEALHDLAPELVEKAIEEQDLEAIDTPDVEFEAGDQPVIKATVPLKPTVSLGDYKSIRVKPDPVEVTPEQVEEAMESVRARNAPWEQVDRAAEFGDLLTIDVDGRVEGESVISEKGSPYQPNPDMDFPVVGFSQQLEGMGKGESKEFTLTLPDDFRQEEIAGKECEFKVTVQEVKAKLPGAVDEEFVKGLDGDYEDLADFRAKTTEALEEHTKQLSERKFEEELMQALKEKASIEAPPNLTEREIDHMIVDEARSIAQAGLEFGNYLRAIGQTPEGLRDARRESAQNRVTTSLILNELAEVEGIEASEEEIDEEIRDAESQADTADPEALERLHSDEVRVNIGNRVRLKKAVERMKEIAQQGPALVVSGGGAVNENEEKDATG